MAKKKEDVVEEVIETTENTEIQTVFNEDGLDVLCADDTIVENVEEGE